MVCRIRHSLVIYRFGDFTGRDAVTEEFELEIILSAEGLNAVGLHRKKPEIMRRCLTLEDHAGVCAGFKPFRKHYRLSRGVFSQLVFMLHAVDDCADPLWVIGHGDVLNLRG